MSILYNEIGQGYDLTRCADSRITKMIVELLNLRKGSHIVDIACGTGNYTMALRSLDYCVVGVDPSECMLNTAKEKNDSIKWVLGSAENIPLASNSFDGAICTLACHHFENLRRAFSEIYRIIDTGPFVLFTCTHKQIRHYWLYKYFPEVLETMITYMPDIHIVIDLLCEVGFIVKTVIPYRIDKDLRDNFLGARIEAPELYLEESFRQGMSIFSKKAKKHHIVSGCQRLKRDIDMGLYNRDYVNPYGDYVFVTVEKRDNNRD